MDEAYNQHSPHSRRNRSSANLNHLTLAPLTSKLPLSDHDDLPEPAQHISYIEGKSAPTTPSILSRSSSRVSLHKPKNLSLPKSKSSTHLLVVRRQPRSGATTPGGTRLRKGITRDELVLSAKDRNDSDWLLRTSALISSSTQESKGQSWLVSRASSTSLHRDEDEEALERELAREREQTSRRASRRESLAAAFDADDEFSPVTTRRSLSFVSGNGPGSRPASRYGSRRGSKGHIMTPIERDQPGYFDHKHYGEEHFPVEPDFVDVEEEGYEAVENANDDEAVVRKLARANSAGLGGWIEKMLGWTLFAVDEDGEETELEISDEKTEDSQILSRTPSRRNLDGLVEEAIKTEQMPALQPEDAGGWNDAAWLLSVATRVLL